MSRLQEKYQNELAGEIQKKLGLKNAMQVPREQIASTICSIKWRR